MVLRIQPRAMKEDDKHNNVITEVTTVKMNNKDKKTNAPKVLPDKYSSVHTTKYGAAKYYSLKHKNVLCISKWDFKKTYETLKKKIKKEKVKKR